MKITKWISIERELEIEIVPEDLRRLHIEDPIEMNNQLVRVAARCHETLSNLDLSMFTEEQREIVADALARLAYRFDPHTEDFDPLEFAEEIAKRINRKNWRRGADPSVVLGEEV